MFFGGAEPYSHYHALKFNFAFLTILTSILFEEGLYLLSNALFDLKMLSSKCL